MEKCPICQDCYDVSPAEISKKRASRTAHDLAQKKANEGMEGLEWEEVYAVYFPKIYRHEYKRNLKLESEIALEKSIEKHQDNPKVCSYHYENVLWYYDGNHAKCMARTRKEYANTKWPKTN